MKVHIKHWSAVAQWRWNTGSADQNDDDDDVCGICRVPYEGCCPSCKMPGDDCPLSACLPVPVSLCLLCCACAESVRTPQSGANAATSSTCTVSSNGSAPPRRNSSARWTADPGVRPPFSLSRWWSGYADGRRAAQRHQSRRNVRSPRAP